MSNQHITADQFEIVNADAPLSDQAIDALADLLLAIDDELGDEET